MNNGFRLNEWQDNYRLGDGCKIKHGFAFKGEFMTVEDDDTLPIVVNIVNFQYTGGFRFETTNIQRYAGAYPKEYELDPGDVLLVMTCQTPKGEILGVPGRIPQGGQHFLHNQRMGLAVLRDPKTLDLSYLYYLFLSPPFNQHLFATATGAKILHTAPARIEDYRFSRPPVRAQRRIASILSAYDDLIANNTRRIKIVEEMAQMLYRAWFVNFRFPGHEKVRIVESELGPIPKGWAVEPLGEHLTVLETGSRPKGGVGDIHEGVPNLGAESILGVGRFDYAKTKYVSLEFFQHMNQGILQDRDVLVYKDGRQPGTFHPHVSLVGESFPFAEMAINSHVYRLRGADPITQDFLYYHLSSEEILKWMHRHGTGSAIPGLARKDLSRLPLILPPPELLGSFDEFARPLTSLILRTAKRTANLRITRDLLLPKLISGEIPVGAADEAAAELVEQPA